MNATPPPAAADPLSAIGVADMADLPNKISRCVDSPARVGQKSYRSSICEREDLPTKPIRGAGVSPYVSDTIGERSVARRPRRGHRRANANRTGKFAAEARKRR